MTTKVERAIEVEVPVRVAYDQWTQFEAFPQFMGGVLEVRQLDDRNVHWVAEIAGVRREWDATILEQVPDEKVMWAATQGATNAGAVYFQALGPGRTRVRLTLEYEPTGLVENVGDKLNVVERQAEADLEKLKAFIESEGRATGMWRGSVNEGLNVEPTADIADATKDDDGKAGISPKAMVAGAVVAAAGVAAARALRSDKEDAAAQAPDQSDAEEIVVEEVVIVDPEPPSDLTADDAESSSPRQTDTPRIPPI